ncbi:MAG: hypothetical protein CL607_28825 [Anaerolineaceae bacterium]|jgi:hypothetical protein|nr:hypothetical protein [Anaerolineaceae bacterium]MAU13856.1 hypothetical protein [Anaerolineaceae bacterium]
MTQDTKPTKKLPTVNGFSHGAVASAVTYHIVPVLGELVEDCARLLAYAETGLEPDAMHRAHRDVTRYLLSFMMQCLIDDYDETENPFIQPDQFNKAGAVQWFKELGDYGGDAWILNGRRDTAALLDAIEADKLEADKRQNETRARDTDQNRTQTGHNQGVQDEQA